MNHIGVFLGYLVLTLLLTNCAGRSYESDRTDPSYQKVQTSPYDPSGRDQALAAGTLVAAGIALASNRDYYKSVAITGRCVCVNKPSDTIEFPCPPLEVVLKDLKGHELTRVQPFNGDFAIRVQKEVAYRIQVVSEKFKADPPPSHNLYLGDDVIIRLVRKPL